MKRNMKFLLFAASVLSVFGLTSCDENATIDIPGPAVDFTFNYDDIHLNTAPKQRAANDWEIIVSETVPGKNVVEFLEKDSANKKYADAVEAATLTEGKLTVTGGDGTLNFGGVDSVKITYQLTAGSATYDLVVGGPDVQDLTTVKFGDIKITKNQALEMLQSEKVVTLLVKRSATVIPNCFVSGAVYRFSAKSILSVKAMSALGNGVSL